MKKGTMIAFASGIVIAAGVYFFRRRLRELFTGGGDEEVDWEGRETYNIRELMPQEEDPFEKIKEKIKE